VAGATSRRRRRAKRKVAVPAVIMAISIQWRFFIPPILIEPILMAKRKETRPPRGCASGKKRGTPKFFLGNSGNSPGVQESKKESCMSAERWKEDEALLESLRNGAPGAVDELLRLYQGKIFNLAMSILKNESDAEEAAQDVFMTVIRKVETFQGNSAFYSWIYRICVNTCLMRLRGKRRNDTVSIEEFMPVFTDEGMHASPMDDWSKEVERDALNEELGRMIRKYTEELSEKYRVVFVLSDVEGLSNEETAKILGLTVPAIKSRLHRARLYLREQLSRYLLEGKAE
jgi:RNA polymerase sigma-70 factor (ECF subfamily)